MNNSHLNAIRWFTRIVGSGLVLLFLLRVLGYIIEPQGAGKITPILTYPAIGLLFLLYWWQPRKPTEE